MKILFLQFPLQPAWGGAESHTLLLAQGLKKHGCEIFLCSSNKTLVNQFRRHGLAATYSWVGWEPTSIKSLLLFPLTFYIALVKFGFQLWRLHPDVIFCLSLTDKLIATVLSPLSLFSKVIWIEHTRLGNWIFKSPLKPWYQLLSQTVPVIAPSKFISEQLIKCGVKKRQIKIIYPGIISSQSTPPPAPERKPDTFTLGFLGRLTKEKGADFLINAIRRAPQPDQLRLLIGGTGPELPHLKQLVQKLNLGKQVFFLGYIENKKEFFSKIQALIIPSTRPEAFGLVALEAMACGVPVVASGWGGIKEVIDHKKTGLLFEPKDPDSLWEQIRFCQNQQEALKEIVRQAQKVAVSRFSITKMIDEYAKLLR